VWAERTIVDVKLVGASRNQKVNIRRHVLNIFMRVIGSAVAVDTKPK
jgi:hypothetical protein